MPRERFQRGWVEEAGKRRKKWRGHYYVYVRQPDGTERRQHRAVVLGLKSEMPKWKAEAALQAIIERETSPAVRPSPSATLDWFWRERYRPMKEPGWKPSSAPKTVWFVEHYILKPFGDVPLGELNRFEIQTYLNRLADKFSRSVVVNVRAYIKAVLDEALEQGFLSKNPARRLEIPRTRKSSKRTLTVEEIAELLGHMNGRDRLIVRMFLVLGLRPGELFALRRSDMTQNSLLRIDESVSPLSGIVEPKTDASCAAVWVPRSLAVELSFWMDTMPDQRSEAFLFPSRRGTPFAPNNFLKRVLKKAAERTRAALRAEGRELPEGFLAGINHQVLRRSCATLMQRSGTVKDIQAHLRHARPDITAEVYIQEIPASVRAAVESLDRMLCGSQRSRTGGVN